MLVYTARAPLMQSQNYPGQDNDALFEYVLQTVERRQRGLHVEKNLITDNLEILAQFLIDRARVKGPYALPGHGGQGDGERAEGKSTICQLHHDLLR